MNTQNRIVSLTKKLIQIPSTNENRESMGEILDLTRNNLKGSRLRKFKKNNVESLLFFNTKKFPKKFKIILNAHLDVVPGKQEQFRPSIVKGKILGRGAQDMKAAAAVEILIFRELANKVNYPLGLQIVTDEEVGGFNGVYHQVEKNVRADFIITGEPSKFDISYMSKGVLWLKLTSKGKSAHGAYPWKGKNALVLLNKALVTIFKIYPTPSVEKWKTTVNLGKILTSNQTYNKVPDSAEAWLDIRYIPQDRHKVLENIKKSVPNNIKIEIILYDTPHLTNKKNRYIKILSNTATKVLGKKPLIIKRNGANDIRHFNKVGCDGVEFGPIGAGLHTDNEWVSIKSLEQYYHILKDFLLSIN